VSAAGRARPRPIVFPQEGRRRGEVGEQRNVLHLTTSALCSFGISSVAIRVMWTAFPITSAGRLCPLGVPGMLSDKHSTWIPLTLATESSRFFVACYSGSVLKTTQRTTRIAARPFQSRANRRRVPAALRLRSLNRTTTLTREGLEYDQSRRMRHRRQLKTAALFRRGYRASLAKSMSRPPRLG
jgi:hypothetical protein